MTEQTKPQVLEYECEVLTPMFLAGADGMTPELRPSSIKSAIRFWWRAFNFYPSYEKMLEKETSLFGGIRGEENKGLKSPFQIKVIPGKIKYGNKEDYSRPLSKRFKTKLQPMQAINFLAFGIRMGDKQIERDYISAGSTFRIEIKFRANTSEGAFKEIKQAVQRWLFIGNLGSKARNGYGALHCRNMENAESLFTGSKYANSKNPPYSVISKFSSLHKTVKTYSSPLEAQSEVAKLYAGARQSTESKESQEKNSRPTKCMFISVNKENAQYRGWYLYMPFEYPKGVSAKSYHEIHEKIISSAKGNGTNLLEPVI